VGADVLAVALVGAVGIGILLGLLGGGGSILTVPLLVYVAGQDPKAAIAASLVVVGTTAAVGAVGHARAGRVQWRTALLFGAAGMIGAYGGGRAAAFVPGRWLLVAFGLIMAATAVAMLRQGRPVDGQPGSGTRARTGRILLDGLAVGGITGMVGAGGGFLIVPALVLLGGLPMATAVGTSLVVIAMKSAAGVLGYLASTSIDWGLTGAITAAAVVGILVGNVLVRRVPDAALRRGFGWLVAASAVTMLGHEVLTLVGGSAATHLVTAIALGGILSVLLLFASCPPCRTWRPHPDRPAHA
jgi:uncharacterized protein